MANGYRGNEDGMKNSVGVAPFLTCSVVTFAKTLKLEECQPQRTVSIRELSASENYQPQRTISLRELSALENYQPQRTIRPQRTIKPQRTISSQRTISLRELSASENCQH